MLGSNSDLKLINKSWCKAWCKWEELLHWKYLILLFLALNLKKLLLYLTSASSLCQIVLFLAKKTLLNVLFGYFWAETRKSYCTVILHQHSQIFLNKKFRSKIKILKFWIKIALIGYFGLEFQCCLQFQFQLQFQF